MTTGGEIWVTLDNDLADGEFEQFGAGVAVGHARLQQLGASG
jgi:hypothetical protein